MLVSNWIIFGTAEAYALIVGLVIFLLFHTHKLKGLIQRLQTRLQEVLLDLKKTKAENLSLQQQSTGTVNYIEHLDTMIQETRAHHASLLPDRDIVLDLTHDAPPARKASAFRFANLITEKEAVLASGGSGFDWGVLENKFQQMIKLLLGPLAPAAQTGQPGSPSDQASNEELLAAQQRIASLEHFQQLFFDMEDQWATAKQEAEAYYQQLLQFQVSDDQQDAFSDALDNYHKVYQQLGGTIEMAGQSQAQTEVITNTIEITKTDERTLRELKALRSVADDQHRLINQLQQKLLQAKTPEAKDEVIRDLQKNLERQLRFVSEAETCIELMEVELSQANKELQSLQAQLQREQQQNSRTAPLKAAVSELEIERRQLQQTIKTLEQENHQLADLVQHASSGGNSDETQALQQEVIKLKTQYADMERRYLELRTRS